MDARVFKFSHGILPASFSTADQPPTVVHSSRGGVLLFGECTAASDWSSVLKLPDRLSARGDLNMPSPILNKDYTVGRFYDIVNL